jgi:adenylosuccinate synthase
MVIDAPEYLNEVRTILKHKPESCELIKIAAGAGIILPVHILLDHLNECLAGSSKIGSTLRGIGPAYEEQTGRRGPKFHEMLDDDAFSRLKKVQDRHLPIISAGISSCEDDKVRRNLENRLRCLDAELSSYLKAAHTLASMIEVIDCGNFIRGILEKGGRILAEGAQGTLLDQTYGMYPFVTSSITTTPGASLGLGISWREIGKVIGVFKAYCTRVGKGPFPTEYSPGLDGHYTSVDGLGYLLQRDGKEFGSTTGRPRRVGALDLPLLKHAAYICGFDALAMTMIDVFNGYDEIEVCVGYENLTSNLDLSRISEMKPIIRKLPWGCQITPAMKKWVDLPEAARSYVGLIEEYVGVSVEMVSTGPGRDEVIRCRVARSNHDRTPGGLLDLGEEERLPVFRG